MPANDRLRARGHRRATRILNELANELRQARLTAGISQRELGRRIGVSADMIWRIENIRQSNLSIVHACEAGAVLGLDFAARTYPNGASIRDAGQAPRLNRLLSCVGSPLTFRTDVPLPQHPGQPTDLRAWDAVLFGDGDRTALELESRMTDIQELTRRRNLKLRDDPVDHFLLVLADTKHNRRVLSEFPELFADLPRHRTATVLKMLKAGQHPPTGLILF